jgi:hypothetical protein
LKYRVSNLKVGKGSIHSLLVSLSLVLLQQEEKEEEGDIQSTDKYLPSVDTLDPSLVLNPK